MNTLSTFSKYSFLDLVMCEYMLSNSLMIEGTQVVVKSEP